MRGLVSVPLGSKEEPSCADADEHLAGLGRYWDFDAFKDLGTAKAANLNAFHHVPRKQDWYRDALASMKPILTAHEL